MLVERWQRSNIGRSSAVDADGRLVRRNDGREGRSGTYCGRRSMTCAESRPGVARVSRRGRAGQRQGCRGGVVEERKLGAGIVRKVALVARQPQSGDRRSLQGCLAVQARVAQIRGRVVPPAAVQDQRQDEVVAGGAVGRRQAAVRQTGVLVEGLVTALMVLRLDRPVAAIPGQ